MCKKIISLLFTFIFIFFSAVPADAANKKDIAVSTELENTKGEIDISADNPTFKKGGRVIIIDINRTNLENFKNIKFLKNKLNKEGYVGLMNIRGDKGYDEKRNYASIGSTGRANINTEIDLDFSTNEKGRKLYEFATGHKSAKINLNNINKIDFYNKSKGEFKSEMGYLGDTLKAHNKKITVLGNADYRDDFGDYVKNRDFCLAFMDTKGRIYHGETDNLNIQNQGFPYGISTDYEKLKRYSSNYLKETDLLYVNLSDTYRLDMYKQNLNKNTYKKMKFKIYNKVNDYLEYIFKQVDDKDTVYIISSFPSTLDYSNHRRLAPIVRFDSNGGKGVLVSSTTRRKGVVANLDLGVDILNRFGLKNTSMVGRKLVSVDNDMRDEYLEKEYKKISAISSIRITIINIYVTLVSISIVLAASVLWQRKRAPEKYRKTILNVFKELVKFGMIMPLAFLTAPILRPSSHLTISLSIIFMSFLYYIMSIILFKKDDIRQIGFYSLLMIFVITMDALFSTPLMESNIMSYDPMIGARYYGIGNEYEGVTIGSAILGFGILLENKKIPKYIVAALLGVILFISAYPGMGANVGGAISGSIAYLIFILYIYDIKIDIKKSMLVVLAAALLVTVFAIADIMLGLGSHLGNFVEKIMINGPMEIIYVFSRKIEMNVQLAQTTIWVNILLVTILVISFSVFRPNKSLSVIKNRYNVMYKGFLSIIVGCIVTLLVNDSGIISAATDSIYLIIPIIILLIKNKNKEDKNLIDEDLIC